MNKPNPSLGVKMDAYIILLHLRSRGWITTSEIWRLLGWDQFLIGMAIRRIGHINAMTEYLSEKWNEGIPKINVFVLTRKYECTDYICKNVFGTEGRNKQPSAKQLAKYGAKIAVYPKWDKIVEIFRRDAFEVPE
ncbi:MAG: hypothetical protein F4Y88_07015 [Chloroflexi bacterium]|nr:hypothetical protein [Chloroflexota bacterium]